jgi:hypothetical protein
MGRIWYSQGSRKGFIDLLFGQERENASKIRKGFKT